MQRSPELGGKSSTADHREYGHAEVGFDGQRSASFRTWRAMKVWIATATCRGFRRASRDRLTVELAARGDGGRRAPALRAAVPSGGHTHAARHGRPFASSARYLRLRAGWTAKNIVAEHIEQIRAQVGKDRVLLGFSGGVDSSVVAALLHEAIGDQLVCVFVDNGLLRTMKAIRS